MEAIANELERWWIFTFGSGQQYEGYFCKVYGTRLGSRDKMRKKYGNEWAFQYTLDEWGQWLRTKPSWIQEEQFLEKIK